MRHILVYADSLSWGIIPDTRERLPFDQRWPGVLENNLNASGQHARVIEDCLNGRRTVWDDPFKPGRNGVTGLAQRIEIHSPLALVILMLGTNDFQFCHPYNNAWSAARGIGVLVNQIRTAPIEPGMPAPPILIISPPQIRQPRGLVAQKFHGAENRFQGLAEAYAQIAKDLACHHFDAQTVITSSTVDGIHIDPPDHRKLGDALAPVVQPLLESSK